MSVEQISAALSAVGFNAIPACSDPTAHLSATARSSVATSRACSSTNRSRLDRRVTSVVDRQVARIGLCARCAPTPGRRFVAVGCHYDMDRLAYGPTGSWAADMVTAGGVFNDDHSSPGSSDERRARCGPASSYHYDRRARRSRCRARCRRAADCVLRRAAVSVSNDGDAAKPSIVSRASRAPDWQGSALLSRSGARRRHGALTAVSQQLRSAGLSRRIVKPDRWRGSWSADSPGHRRTATDVHAGIQICRACLEHDGGAVARAGASRVRLTGATIRRERLVAARRLRQYLGRLLRGATAPAARYPTLSARAAALRFTTCGSRPAVASPSDLQERCRGLFLTRT